MSIINTEKNQIETNLNLTESNVTSIFGGTCNHTNTKMFENRVLF